MQKNITHTQEKSSYFDVKNKVEMKKKLKECGVGNSNKDI